MGFGSYQTAWTWLHKIRKAMVAPGRQPLAARVEADETYVGSARPATGILPRLSHATSRDTTPRSRTRRRRPVQGDGIWCEADLALVQVAAAQNNKRASPPPGPPPWCGAGTPIRSASCATPPSTGTGVVTFLVG
jgi:hypothetical protein